MMLLTFVAHVRFQFPVIQVGESSYVSPIAFGLLFFAFAPLLGTAMIEALYRILKSR